MNLLWVLMAVLVVVSAVAALRRRRSYDSAEAEPWRASLPEEAPLNMDEIRQAEEEWLGSRGWEEPPEDESWR